MARTGSLHAVPPPTGPVILNGRVLVCAACAERVELFEFPRPVIDEAAFVCGECLIDPEPAPTPTASPFQVPPAARKDTA